MGPTNQKKKWHLVGWDVFTKQVAQGGLGIKTSKMRNKDLLEGFSWRLDKEDSLLGEVVDEEILASPVFHYSPHSL